MYFVPFNAYKLLIFEILFYLFFRFDRWRLLLSAVCRPVSLAGVNTSPIWWSRSKTSRTISASEEPEARSHHVTPPSSPVPMFCFLCSSFDGAEGRRWAGVFCIQVAFICCVCTNVTIRLGEIKKKWRCFVHLGNAWFICDDVEFSQRSLFWLVGRCRLSLHKDRRFTWKVYNRLTYLKGVSRVSVRSFSITRHAALLFQFLQLILCWKYRSMYTTTPASLFVNPLYRYLCINCGSLSSLRSVWLGEPDQIIRLNTRCCALSTVWFIRYVQTYVHSKVYNINLSCEQNKNR